MCVRVRLCALGVVCRVVYKLCLYTCLYMHVGEGPSTGVTPALPLPPLGDLHVFAAAIPEKELSHNCAEQSQREHTVPALAPINFLVLENSRTSTGP